MTIRRWALALACVVAGWIGTLMLVMVATDAAPGAIVLFPEEDFVANLPRGAAVVGGGGACVAVRSDAPGLGLALYRAGGRVVLPAGLPGCLPLPAGKS
ncbi:hypothetical protein XM53_02840 [Roseovarius atlanticus]|uniref:Uncharacterized protein n=1 Tax=Roseovarius atlanticus TaxID=1641875 RepID=A0A0T5P0K8_9RHOB|nr:hypothetical protein [Roseovarius atlanticus]KRS14654.1 hypothetical protein XM53_02840 [Roseovarius atlanticus]